MSSTVEGELVTVVIPCYNARTLVGDAIQSALNQTHPQVEVIVIDDGSTDDSLSVIRSFGDRIRWETGPNRGGSVARNRGLRMARGEVIQFLDADDLLDPRKLELQLPELREDPDCLVFCDARVIDYETNVALATWGGECVASDDAIVYVLNTVLQTGAPLHRKANLLKVNGWDEKLQAGQDRDLHIRLACVGIRFKHVKRSLLTVRRLRDSLSDRSRVLALSCWRKSALDAYRELTRGGLLSEERTKAFAGYFAKIGRLYMRYRMSEDGMECFEQARSIHPDGGILQAYGAVTQWLRRLLGPLATEYVVQKKRKIRNQCFF